MNNGNRKLLLTPVTRIEGHLRMQAVLDENNVIVDAMSTGTMWRGLEVILKGRDPRDAWAFVERVCGVCTGIHALSAVRAVEDALGIQIPKNANIIRNLMNATLYSQDHLTHFYQLHGCDWIDVVSALSADPKKTSEIQQSISTHALSSPAYFKEVQDRLKAFVASGQLGIFANAYWGNPGYKLTGMTDNRTGYPTQQVTDGYRGNGLKLTTCDTGSFGAMVQMYIAAGNLFIGSFDLANALKDPLRATKFGIQYYKRPIALKGYFKFKAGEVYTDEGEVQKDMKDRFDIYAILYEANENSFMLDGSNSLTSENIVAKAQISEEAAVETDEWTAFELPFEPMNGKEINKSKLQDGKYKLSIVLSSSVKGAYFKGAVGSTLYVDELELISEEI